MNKRTIAGFMLAAVLVSLTCWRLGLWQYHRYIEHRGLNAATAAHANQPEVSAEHVLPIGAAAAGLDPALNWRPVSVQGSFVPGSLVLWRNRTHNTQVGMDVLAAIRSTTGQVVLVDCGWQARTQAPPTLPTGPVRVQGWLRADPGAGAGQFGWAPAGVGDSGGLAAPSLATLDTAQLAAQLSLALTPGLIQARVLDPPLTGLALPEQGPQPLSTTRHITYAWQWWLFALLAPLGFFLLGRRGAREEHPPPNGPHVDHTE